MTMLKNITLKVEETLIRQAREKAQKEHMTLSAIFRQWLMRYVGQGRITTDYEALMEYLSYAQAGRPFGREELNER